MMQKRGEPELIRQYLLGDLDEGQQEEIEERLLTDEKLQAALSDAQDNLIDDYVVGTLTERERELFKRNFLLTPERLHKLRLSQALVKYAAVKVADSQETYAVAPAAPWQNPLHFLSRKRIAVAISSAVILLVIGYGGWAIYQRRQMENRLAKFRSQQLQIEQELARLNTGQLSEQQASITPLNLKQLLVRDTGEMRRVIITEGIDILQLRLELDEDKFPVYRAFIETDEGVGAYTINNLKSRAVNDRVLVVLNLPGRLLPTGNYRVRLSGIVAQKEPVDVGIYPFQVVLK